MNRREHELIEGELKKREEQLRSYFDAGLIGMAITSADKKFIQFNDKYCEIMGYSRTELAKMSWAELTHPDDIDTSIKQHNRVLNGEIDNYSLDKRYIRKDGKLVYTTISIKCIRKADKSLDYFVAFLQDITERKLVEKALRKSEENFSKAFYNMPDAVVITRLRDGMLMFFNQAFTELTGYRVEEAVGKTSQELGLWNNPEERRPFLEIVEREGGIKGYETYCRHKDGEYFPIAMSISIIEMDEEDCLVIWAHDQREAEQAERERQQLERQLFRSQKMEALGQLTGGIAHDFNNILTAILGYTNLALRYCGKSEDAQLREYLKEIKHGGERARDMIDQMLIFSRSIPNEPRYVSIPPLIERAIKLLRPAIPSNIEIKIIKRDKLPYVKIDPTQFEQTIMNLCINAHDAIEGNGLIEIDLKTEKLEEGRECDSCHAVVEGNFLIIIVKDSGSGMPDEIISRIFDPFFSTKEVGQGSGMGLSMLHGIMHDCGGHVYVDSIINQGTVFSLLFPAVPEKEVEKIIPSHLMRKSEKEYISDSHIIMVIDDEPSIANYLGELLKNHGYEVEVFTDSMSALEVLLRESCHIDLIITDQTMPVMTGIELARELFSTKSDIPIIINSGYSDIMDKNLINTGGISAYFKKPIDEEKFLQKVGELLAVK